MSKPVTFESGSQYVRGKTSAYEIIRVLNDGTVIIRNLRNQQLGSESLAKLSQEWSEGILEFTTTGENLCTIPGLPVKTTYEFDALGDLPLSIREETWHRYQLIEPLLHLPSAQCSSVLVKRRIHVFLTNPEEIQQRTGASLLFGARIGKNRKPKSQEEEEEIVSVRSVQRWIQRFKKNGDIRSLVPSYHHRGPQKSYLDPIVEELIKKAVQKIYLQSERPPVTSVITEVKAKIIQANKDRMQSEQLKTPGKMTIYRYLQSLDPLEVDVARFGPAQARKNQKQTWNGPQSTRPNQQVEFDFSPLDVIVIDANDRLPIGRPTIAALRDRYTGYISGFFISFEPPSYRLVMECMLYAFLPKPHVKSLFDTKNDYLPYGIPETLIVDNGIELDVELETACLQLGIELVHLPVRKPWFKGRIERWFRTVSTGLIHIIPGTTFSNILERGEYRSEHHACITIDELWTALHLWLIDDYAQSAHRGLGQGHGVGDAKRGIPAQLWLRACEQGFVPKLPPRRDDLLVLISRTTRRTIQHYGIDFENIRYQSNDLGPLREHLTKQKQQQRHTQRNIDEKYEWDGKVQIKYHPGDLSHIWVLDETKQYKHYIEIEALDAEYTRGLSLWKHRLIVQYAREQIKRDLCADDLVLAKARLQEYISQKARTNKHLRSRQKAARFLDQQVSTWLHTASTPDMPVSPDPFFSAPPIKESPSGEIFRERNEGKVSTRQKCTSESSLSVLEASAIDPPTVVAGITLIQSGESFPILEAFPALNLEPTTTAGSMSSESNPPALVIGTTTREDEEVSFSNTTVKSSTGKRKKSSPKKQQEPALQNTVSPAKPKMSPEEEFAAFGIIVSYHQRKNEVSL